MKTKRIFALLLVAALVLSCLTGCGNKETNEQQTDNTQQSSSDTAADNTQKTDSTVTTDTSSEVQGNTDTSSAGNDTTVEASDTSSAAVTQTFGTMKVTTEVTDGFVTNNGVFTINKAGEYTFEGTLAEGQIYVNAPDEKVTIVLAGVTISSELDSVIYVGKADEVTIKAQKDTVNTLNDNRARKVKGNETNAGSGCIYSKDDLSFSGKGTLTVNANYNNGIYSKNDIKIKNIILNVNSTGDAIQGNDSIKIESGTITVVSTEGDGLKTKNKELSSKGKQEGVITIETGIVTITAADDCIKAAYASKINEGPDTTVTQQKYSK